MTGMGLMGASVPPPGLPGADGAGAYGQSAPAPSAPFDPSMMGMDSSMMGGSPPAPGVPGMPSTDPGSMAQLIAQAIAQATGQDQAQLASMQHDAAAGALQHPVVQAMLAGPPPSMRGVAGGALPPAPLDPGQGGPWGVPG